MEECLATLLCCGDTFYSKTSPRKEGVPAKSVIVLFAKGDQNVPNIKFTVKFLQRINIHAGYADS